jgi:hypothetical protein
VIAKVATLAEIESHYSLTDVLDANEALDLQHEADRLAHEQATGKTKLRAG